MGKKEENEKFYLVREDVLPEAMKKTLDAKELIERKKPILSGKRFRKWT